MPPSSLQSFETFRRGVSLFLYAATGSPRFAVPALPLSLYRAYACLPLLGRLHRQGRVELPAALRGEAARAYARQVGLDLLYLKTAAGVSRLLGSEGVEHIWFKGAWLLSERVYPLGVRPMTDLDLYVPSAALPLARRVLLGKGWELLYDNRGNQIVLRERARRVRLELHWHFFNQANPFEREALRPPAVRWWERRVPLDLEPGSFALCPVDHFLYLGCHLIKEHFAHPKWVADLWLLGRRLGRDGRKAASERARREGLERPYGVALSLLHDCLQPRPRLLGLLRAGFLSGTARSLPLRLLLYGYLMGWPRLLRVLAAAPAHARYRAQRLREESRIEW